MTVVARATVEKKIVEQAPVSSVPLVADGWERQPSVLIEPRTASAVRGV
jgi:hypothetical protein